MTSGDLLRLLALAAIWGASFPLMRIASPILGSAYLAEGRVFIAAVFLYGLTFLLHKNRQLLRHWKHFLMVGFFNSALPFLLFGFAALYLSASQLSILNATAPIWAFLIALSIGTEKLQLKRSMGLLLGVIGVVILFGDALLGLETDTLWAMSLGLMAAFCYGIASNYAKTTKSMDSFDQAHGSMWAAAIFLIPTLPFIPMRAEPTTISIVAVLAIGIVCSGVAYLLYFRLIQDTGATSALTVTFLIPIFGTSWGILFLNEPLTWNGVVGMVIILIGTALVTGLNLKNLLSRSKSQLN
jgi:drug/metabolite transporter (DMT)-like permease